MKTLEGQKKEKKVSGFWSSVGFKIVAAMRFFSGHLFIYVYVIHCIRRDQISHVQSMVAKRCLTNRANVHTPMWKRYLKHSAAEFQSIQQFLMQLDIIT